jgi:hypothetical protein
VELLVNSVHGNGFLFSHFQTYLVLLAMATTVTLQIKCMWDSSASLGAAHLCFCS